VGAPLSPPRSWGPPSPSGIEFGHEILETKLSYGENPKSLSHIVSNWYQDMTDGRTSGQNYRKILRVKTHQNISIVTWRWTIRF